MGTSNYDGMDPQEELRPIRFCVSFRATGDCKDSSESLELVSSPASFIAWAYEGKPSIETHRSGSHTRRKAVRRLAR